MSIKIGFISYCKLSWLCGCPVSDFELFTNSQKELAQCTYEVLNDQLYMFHVVTYSDPNFWVKSYKLDVRKIVQ